jgi:hypothetical protein
MISRKKRVTRKQGLSYCNYMHNQSLIGGRGFFVWVYLLIERYFGSNQLNLLDKKTRKRFTRSLRAFHVGLASGTPPTARKATNNARQSVSNMRHICATMWD